MLRYLVSPYMPIITMVQQVRPLYSYNRSVSESYIITMGHLVRHTGPYIITIGQSVRPATRLTQLELDPHMAKQFMSSTTERLAMRDIHAHSSQCDRGTIHMWLTHCRTQIYMTDSSYDRDKYVSLNHCKVILWYINIITTTKIKTTYFWQRRQ